MLQVITNLQSMATKKKILRTIIVICMYYYLFYMVINGNPIKV